MRDPVLVALYLAMALFFTGCCYVFWTLLGAPTGTAGQLHILSWLLAFYFGHRTLKTAGQQRLWQQRLQRVLEGTGLLQGTIKKRVEGWGRLRGLEIALVVQPVEDGQRLLVSIPGLTRALRLSATEHVVGAPLHTGDPAFDGAIYLSGDRVEALSLLDSETRGIIGKLGIAALRVEDGELNAELLMYPADPETVRASLLYLADIAHRLRHQELERGERERSLLEAARTAKRPDARFQRLNALLREAEDPEVRAEALALTGSDRRLALAVMVARDELDDAEKLTALVADTGLPARIRREALSHLPADAEDAEALAAALTDHDRALRLAALRRISARPRDSARLEARLLGMLEARQGAEQEAVIQALALAGGTGAVAPLQALAGSGIGVGRLAQSARAAVSAIQGRLVNAEVGAFAVIEQEDAEGSVSLTADAGAIALSELQKSRE